MLQSYRVQILKNKKLTFRVYATLAAGYLFSLGVLSHAWKALMEGSVLIYVRAVHGTSYIATRGGPNEHAFYVDVFGKLTLGAIILLPTLIVTWVLVFSRRNARRDTLLDAMNTPTRAHGPSIPTWIFWAVIALWLGGLLYAGTQ